MVTELTVEAEEDMVASVRESRRRAGFMQWREQKNLKLPREREVEKVSYGIRNECYICPRLGQSRTPPCSTLIPLQTHPASLPRPPFPPEAQGLVSSPCEVSTSSTAS